MPDSGAGCPNYWGVGAGFSIGVAPIVGDLYILYHTIGCKCTVSTLFISGFLSNLIGFDLPEVRSGRSQKTSAAR